MNLSDLHQNEALRQKEFPVCGKSIFLGHAGVCPIPRRVSEAMIHYASQCMGGDQEEVFPRGVLSKTRALASRLLNCRTEEIALVGPTSIGLSLVANGLNWKEGDNVVFYAEDYPSNAVPWMNLVSKGVECRLVQARHLGAITVEDLKPLVDKRTRLVALASAHFISGHRLDLDTLGSWIRSQGTLFCVDGIQTLGALRTSMTHVDFLAADAHKWLLGPCAAGILYVRTETQCKLNPTLLGWNNVLCPGYVTPQQVEYPKHAGRYEAGSHNLFGVLALHEAISMILEYGIEEIEQTILDHTRFLRTELRQRGYQLSGESDQAISGITAIRRESIDLPALHQKLTAANIISSLRQTRDGHHWIRFSPHFYNTRDELAQLLKLL